MNLNALALCVPVWPKKYSKTLDPTLGIASADLEYIAHSTNTSIDSKPAAVQIEAIKIWMCCKRKERCTVLWMPWPVRNSLGCRLSKKKRLADSPVKRAAQMAYVSKTCVRISLRVNGVT